ncbi:HlyD family type I secretion periplasmic adaptor subunit [Rhizobium sp. FKL33]|uniref:HlyD family type I secretion periplasmic adaptor subunit n=1 Tax=Rhizobium sp. FKL33 TaxID=2562307 RepID=UPI0010C0F29A|nr:HlyD family type I secretion periplasmic adaptor subunit [Rhizobium sp. FKL33]
MSASITLPPTEYHRQPAGQSALSAWDEVVAEERASRVSLAGPVLLGLATLLFGVGGFGLWAAVTPLSSAAIASGRVIVESNTKTISHIEGGSLLALAVHEGQHVKEGDLLLQLDSTRSRATVAQLSQQLYVLHVRLERLIAERDEQDVLTVTVAPPAAVDAVMARQLVDTEKKLFSERRSQRAGEDAAGRATIDQLDSQREALVARRASWMEQLHFVARDLKTVTSLESKQLATQTALHEKTIQLIDMKTRIAESDASIAENSQRRKQSELEVANRRTEYFRALSEQIQAAQAEIARLSQELIAARDVVAKADIRSPQDGVVANIRLKTPGSAVVSGQAILDIVPANQPMLIEGRARAMDIDTVHVGQKAEIHLNAFGASESRPLIGTVSYVAPDGVADERTGDVNFVFRTQIDPRELAKQPNLFLYPGMTATVNIVTGQRTAMAYLVGPFLKSFNQAFRED